MALGALFGVGARLIPSLISRGALTGVMTAVRTGGRALLGRTATVGSATATGLVTRATPRAGGGGALVPTGREITRVGRIRGPSVFSKIVRGAIGASSTLPLMLTRDSPVGSLRAAPRARPASPKVFFTGSADEMGDLFGGVTRAQTFAQRGVAPLLIGAGLAGAAALVARARSRKKKRRRAARR